MIDHHPRNTLVIFVKEPRPGRVKTRLGQGIGHTTAAWWFRHQSMGLLRRLGRDRRWRTVLAVSPDREGCQSRVWPAHLTRWPQGTGDLGQRMGRALREMPPGRVIVIGADIPGITPGHIAKGFRALGQKDAVIGPAADGGYWLIGARRGGRALPKGLFSGVRWSTGHAFSDTLATLQDRQVAKLSVLHDVDVPGDVPRAGIRAL